MFANENLDISIIIQYWQGKLYVKVCKWHDEKKILGS